MADATRSLTDAGTATATGNGGIGTGIFGAMLTAAATTAGTTATISGTNTSMNANGSIWNQVKTTTDSSYKTNTSSMIISKISKYFLSLLISLLLIYQNPLDFG